MMKHLCWLALVVFLSGCEGGRVAITVDLQSFLDLSSTQLPYGPVPAGLTATVRSTPDQVELLEGVGDVFLLDSVFVAGATSVRNESGNASFEFRIYFDSLPDPYTGAPAVVVSGTVQPATTTDVSFDELLVPALYPVFQKRSLWVGVEVFLVSGDPPFGPFLSGRVDLISFTSRLVGQEDLF